MQSSSTPTTQAHPREFLLFAEVPVDLLAEAPGLKVQPWTPEITIYNCNLIVDEFVESKEDKMPTFFPSFLAHHHPANRRAKLRHALRLHLSLNHYARDNQMAALYLNLFATQTDHAVYNLFYQTRGLILELKGELKTLHADLDRLFVNERQWQYVLRCIFNFSLEQIQDFEVEMAAAVLDLKRDRRLRTRVYKFCRNEEYCASFFLQHTMNKFYQIYAEAQARSVLQRGEDSGLVEEGYRSEGAGSRRASRQELGARRAVESERRPSSLRRFIAKSGSSQAIFEAKETDSLEKTKAEERKALKAKVSDIIQKADDIRAHALPKSEEDAVKIEIFRSKMCEKERLLEQIKDVTREKEAYSLNAARILCVLEKTDEILEILRGRVTRLRTTLAMHAPKSSHEPDADLGIDSPDDFLLPDNDFGKLVTNGAVTIKNAIHQAYPLGYQKIVAKKNDLKPRLNGLTTRLYNTVFDPSYHLVPTNYEYDLEEFKVECFRHFGNRRNLSDEQLLILNTFVNNIPVDVRHHGVDVRVSNTFTNVSNNLIATIQGLLTAQLSEKETEQIEDFQTFNQQLGTVVDRLPTSDLNELHLAHDSMEAHGTDGGNTPNDRQKEVLRSLREKYQFLKDPFFGLPQFSWKRGVSNKVSQPRPTKIMGLSKTSVGQPADFNYQASGSEKKFTFNEVHLSQNKTKFVPDEIVRTFAGTGNSSLSPISGITELQASHRKSELLRSKQTEGGKKPSVNVFVPSDKGIDHLEIQEEDNMSGRLSGMGSQSAKPDLPEKAGAGRASQGERNQSGAGNISSNGVSGPDQQSFKSQVAETGDDRRNSRASEVRGKKSWVIESIRSNLVGEKEFQMQPNSLRDAGEVPDETPRSYPSIRASKGESMGSPQAQGSSRRVVNVPERNSGASLHAPAKMSGMNPSHPQNLTSAHSFAVTDSFSETKNLPQTHQGSQRSLNSGEDQKQTGVYSTRDPEGGKQDSAIAEDALIAGPEEFDFS